MLEFLQELSGVFNILYGVLFLWCVWIIENWRVKLIPLFNKKGELDVSLPERGEWKYKLLAATIIFVHSRIPQICFSALGLLSILDGLYILLN